MIMLLSLPEQHHEDEASLFLPIGQPSQGFGHNQLNDSALSMLLVLFSQHAKPENIQKLQKKKKKKGKKKKINSTTDQQMTYFGI